MASQRARAAVTALSWTSAHLRVAYDSTGHETYLSGPATAHRACSHTGMYALSDRTPADQAMTFNGTVLSVEADGDFLLETSGRLLLVDVGDTGAKVELGDRVTVAGRTDNDKDEAEAPELDAESVTDWLPPSP